MLKMETKEEEKRGYKMKLIFVLILFKERLRYSIWFCGQPNKNG